MRKTPSPVHAAFSLIELLTVIAVIAILAAILIPTIGGVRERAGIVTATADARSIATAWKVYYADRGKWPDPQQFEGEGSYANSAAESAEGQNFWNAYVKLLTGQFELGESSIDISILARYNPGREAYLPLDPEQIDENGEFIDPWNHPYKFKLDKEDSTDTEGHVVHGRLRGDLLIGKYPYGDEYGSPANPTDLQIVVEDISIAWSRGPDGFDHTAEYGEDDPRSW